MKKYQGVSTLEVLQDAKNYNQWIADEIDANISSPTLEVGAGTGNLTKHFLHIKKIWITDSDRELVKQLKEKFIHSKGTTVTYLDVTKIPPLKFRSVFSTIYGINVLEHIENDTKALKHIHKMLKKNGKVILLVPAKQVAYTKLDRELGHYRRYEKEELRSKIEKAGYKIEKLYFFNLVGLLSWYIRDKVSRKSILMKPYQIALFDAIVPLLRIIESKVRIPVGISLIAVAKKI